MSIKHKLFVTCPKGLEGLLLQELQQLGAQSVKETVLGVYCTGDLSFTYRCCMWSRLANRVLLIVKEANCHNLDDYYNEITQINWLEHFSVDQTFAISFSGSMKAIRHTHFGALKAKDAIADYFTARFGRRPNVEPKNPDVGINVRVHRGKLTIAIDMAGESLHKRGYRSRAGAAPLKENLAAAILLRADWPAVAARGGALIDPMCGSGTLLIEAALMSANIAPGLLRQDWGFSEWQGHQKNLWAEIYDDAVAIKKQAMQKQWPDFQGYDASQKAIDLSQEHIDRAGLHGKVNVFRKPLSQLVKPTHKPFNTGLIICNPPYGERLGDVQELEHLYRHFADRMKKEFVGWQAGLFTGNPELGKKMGLKSYKQYQLMNGALPAKLLMFDLQEQYFIQQKTVLNSHIWGTEEIVETSNNEGQNQSSKHSAESSETPKAVVTLTPGSQMFANRLSKNFKRMKKWLKQSGNTCYRLYDADMPEYSVAIDCYNDWVHVSEYTPPASINVHAAIQRLDDVMSAIPQVLNIERENIVLKQRSRQKGSEQYTKQDNRNEQITVQEGQAKLLVNLHDYLDTGLFLDHRPVRLFIAEQAKGKRFLNLFSYTAVASLQAAVGGSKMTDSVDLSATYLSWARQNFSLNGLSLVNNRTHQADVREWLAANTDKSYDLILLDPPTFSNSKRMDGTLDIQRDHIEFIDASMKLLAKDGLLIFSNNQRKFKLAEEISDNYLVEDKTQWSLDEDFKRSKGIHQCWFIKHK